ncbi:MAG TPA: hypothetical protein VHM70_07185 [Polyangiaceae bacterium]|nr:hypothetical protein [Polyangiaceae bacterium]
MRSVLGASLVSLLLFGCGGSTALEQELGANEPLPAATRKPMRERLSHSSLGLPRAVSANGVKSVALEQRFSHAAVARRGADGKLELGCIDRASALDAWHTQPTEPVNPIPVTPGTPAGDPDTE